MLLVDNKIISALFVQVSKPYKILKHAYFNLGLLFLFLILLIYSTANAAFLSNGFVVTSKFFEFNKNSKTGHCYGRIAYPVLSSDIENESVTAEINGAIYDFVEIYNICETKGKIPPIGYDLRTGSKNYFSVRWLTTANDKLMRIDAISFAAKTGKLLSVDDIFNSLARDFMPQIVKLSKGNLAADTSWEQFLTKIEQKSISFYIFESKWYIVFNSYPDINKPIVEAILPHYLLKG